MHELASRPSPPLFAVPSPHRRTSLRGPYRGAVAALFVAMSLLGGGAADCAAGGSADVQGCQHWGLSAAQQKQEQYARRLRKAVLFEGADTLAHLVAAIRDDLGTDAVSLCCRLGNSNGKCALHMAAWRGDEAAVSRLLELGARVNAITIRGQTALHFAVGKRRESVVALLLDRGAKTRIRTVKGETPVSLADKCRVAEPVRARLLDAEAAEEEWVDFEGFYRARSHRRLIMAQLGTIIYSTGGVPEEEEEEEEGGGGEGQDRDVCRKDGTRPSRAASPADGAGVEGAESELVSLFVGADEATPEGRPGGGANRGRRMFRGLHRLAKKAMATVKHDPLLLARTYVGILRRSLAHAHGPLMVLDRLVMAVSVAAAPSRQERSAYR